MDDQNSNHLISASSPLPNSLKGVKFTPREMEVLACILGGRTGKKVASLLSLSPKTVENYIHTIMQKLECSSRESIKDWLETCEEIDLLTKYYSELLFRDNFQKHIKDLSMQASHHSAACSFIYWIEESNDTLLISQLEKDLKLAGIAVSADPQVGPCNPETLKREAKEDSTKVCVVVVPTGLKNTFSQSKRSSSSGHLLLLMKDKKQIPFNFVSPESTQDRGLKNYHACLVELLQYFFPEYNFASLLFLIKKHYQQTMPQSSSLSSERQNKTIQQSLALIISNRKWQYSLGFFLFIACMIVLFSALKMETRESSPESQIASIRSDLVIPIGEALLDRSELIHQIENKFQNTQPIQTVALIGLGGSGKTTTARQYAQQRKANVVWEINAETRESLNTSFENLGLALARTESDKEKLREIQEIKDLQKREAALILFVKSHLRAISNWLLIFDNVEKFTDIQPYFPQDKGTWGEGRVILTTRDSHIESNPQVNYVLFIGELNTEQKLDLFTKILTHGTEKELTVAQLKEAKKFLENIPPFPLDVSTAAYYLKATQTSYQDYLDNLETYHQNFANVQENLLKETGPYIKTRYGIVTLSLENLIKEDKNFVDLLLFISLLGSQNIPKEIFKSYKDAVIVDNFIYHLKKYSLVTNESFIDCSSPTLSFHRSTQAIILAHLSKQLNLQENNLLITSIAQTLENYVKDAFEREELSKMKSLIPHLEAFLTHEFILTDQSKENIENSLGHIYSSLSLFKQANYFFEKALLTLQKEKTPNHSKIAENLLLQGNVYNMIAEYGKAEKLLEESITIYKNDVPNSKPQLALGLVYLGNVYRWTGDYEKSKHLLKQAIEIDEDCQSQGTIGNIMGNAYLGDIYRKLGDYEKAITYSTKSLELCKKYFPKDNVRLAWPIIFLGVIYRELGDYEKSLEFINKSIEIYENNFSNKSLLVGTNLIEKAQTYCALENYSQAIDSLKKTFQIYKNASSRFNMYNIFGFAALGNAYKGLGEYKTAKLYLEKSLQFNRDHHGKDHLETAPVLESLGQIYLKEGQLEQAQHFFNMALQIYRKNNHPNAYKCMEDFSELHLKESERALRQGNQKEAEHLKIQAISDLKEALEIIKTRFPDNSPHKERIEAKILKN